MWAVFAGQCCYARGGWHDVRSLYVDAGDAIMAAERMMGTEFKPDPDSDIYATVEWYHVVDLSTGCIVAQSPAQPYGAP